MGGIGDVKERKRRDKMGEGRNGEEKGKAGRECETSTRQSFLKVSAYDNNIRSNRYHHRP